MASNEAYVIPFESEEATSKAERRTYKPKKKQKSRSHRSRLMIIYSILKFAQQGNGARKTHIMKSVSLSFQQLQDYVSFLLRSKLLDRELRNNEQEVFYVSTEKGRNFIEKYRLLVEGIDRESELPLLST